MYKKNSRILKITFLALFSLGMGLLAPNVKALPDNSADLHSAEGLYKFWEFVEISNDTYANLGQNTIRKITKVGDYIYGVGWTNYTGNGGDDLLLMKWDQYGTRIWVKTWGGAKYDAGNYICSDGTYLYVVGSTVSYANGSNQDGVVLKYDLDGNIVWNKTFGSVNAEAFSSIQIRNSRLYICGTTDNTISGHDKVLYVVYDTSGNLISSKMWGEDSADQRGYGITTDPDYVYITGSWRHHVLLLKYDMATGSLVYNQSIINSNWEEANSLTADSNYVYLTGYSMLVSYDEQLLLARFNKDGTLDYERYWGMSYTTEGGDITLFNGSIFVAGYNVESTNHMLEGVFIEFNLNGTSVDALHWGSNSTHYALGVSLYIESGRMYTAGLICAETNMNYNIVLTRWELDTWPDCGYIVTDPSDWVLNEPIHFYTTNLTGGNLPLTFSWEFSDGYSSNEMNTTHIFTKEGIVNVELTITDADGDTTGASISKHVNKKMIPGYSNAFILLVNILSIGTIIHLLKRKIEFTKKI